MELWKKSDQEIVFCSDSGVNNNIAGFGLVARIDNQVVLQNMKKLGDIYNKYTFHQCEAMGLLCAVSTLEAIVLYQESIIATEYITKLIILCDNETVINTINKLKYNNTVLKGSLHSRL
jgi:hypothetical protein